VTNKTVFQNTKIECNFKWHQSDVLVVPFNKKNQHAVTLPNLCSQN